MPKYYWLKLKEDFFSSPKIKKLRRIAGGDTYTIIYLKMQLLSIKSGGTIKYEGIEPTLEDELALILDEDVENVKVTIGFLVSQSLLEEIQNSEYLLPDAASSIGSECDSAKRVREFRERKSLQCNEQVTMSNTDIREKIQDTRDQTIDTEKESISAKPKRNRAEYSELFERFWKAYPKKVAKGTAAKAFKKAKVDESLLQDILKALEWQRETKQWKAEGGQYIPNPATYINGRRWEDEQEEKPNGTNDISGTCEYKLDVLRL